MCYTLYIESLHRMSHMCLRKGQLCSYVSHSIYRVSTQSVSHVFEKGTVRDVCAKGIVCENGTQEGTVREKGTEKETVCEREGHRKGQKRVV